MTSDQTINIVGAGIFGLSTAIHLAQRGYCNVTVFDRLPYDRMLYSYFDGADAASADINKIIRSAYGGVGIYQDLSLEAIEGWRIWNSELASGRCLPHGLTRSDRVFVNGGNFIMTDAPELPAFDLATVSSMEVAGYPKTQLVTTSHQDREIAKSKGFEHALDPFQRKKLGKQSVAVIDTTGGHTVADKACRFALHKARSLGVKFLLDTQAGAFKELHYKSASRGEVVGIETRDGKVHLASMTIMACGGWTPSLIPQLDNLCEATAGSVALLRIPRESPLWDRFSQENFPSWQFKMRDGAEGGLYGFPRDEIGWFKIGYRGTKYTNPVKQPDGQERSVPVTRWSAPSPEEETLTSIPNQGLKIIRRFLSEYLPELAENGIGIEKTRICWYNDSFDNHLLIDKVPNITGLMVATAGSGHAFKYLPVIGKYVADVMEEIGTERPMMKAWKWRRQEPGTVPANQLMEGSTSARALCNIPMTPDDDLNGVNVGARL